MLPAIAVYLSWLLFIGGVLTGSFRPIGAFFGIFATTFIWNLLLMIIDYATYITIVSQLSGILGSTNAQFAFDTQDLVSGKIDKALAFLGYMSLATFGLATTMVGKMSILADKTVSGAITQMQPGMHTLSASAKGGNSFGYTSTTEGATSSIKEVFDKEGTRYVQETYNADGSRETKDLTGKDEIYATKGQNLKDTTTINGNSSQVHQGSDGSMMAINQYGVTKVDMGSDAKMTSLDAISKNIKDSKAKNAEEIKTITKTIGETKEQLQQYLKSKGIDATLVETDSKTWGFQVGDQFIDQKGFQKLVAGGTSKQEGTNINLSANAGANLGGKYQKGNNADLKNTDPYSGATISKDTQGTGIDANANLGANFSIGYVNSDMTTFQDNSQTSHGGTRGTNINDSHSSGKNVGNTLSEKDNTALNDMLKKAINEMDKLDKAEAYKEQLSSTQEFLNSNQNAIIDNIDRELVDLAYQNKLKETGSTIFAQESAENTFNMLKDVNFRKEIYATYADNLTEQRDEIRNKIEQTENTINNKAKKFKSIDVDPKGAYAQGEKDVKGAYQNNFTKLNNELKQKILKLYDDYKIN